MHGCAAERTDADLAVASGTNAGALARLLRALAALELLVESQPGRILSDRAAPA